MGMEKKSVMVSHAGKGVIVDSEKAIVDSEKANV
jgi:hypothetical protein